MREEGRGVVLVPFADGHLNSAEYRTWLADPEVVRYLGRPEYLVGVSFDQIRQYVEQLWADERCTFLAVHTRGEERFVGTTKIAFRDKTGPAPDVADIGVMIGDRRSWGHGLATDALRTTCQYAFRDLGARKLTAGAMSPNVAVIRAFQRIGFAEEGRLRAQFTTEGGYADHVLLGCFPWELREA